MPEVGVYYMRGLFDMAPASIFCLHKALFQFYGFRLSLAGSSGIWGLSSAGRALDLHSRGHRFDPGSLHNPISLNILRFYICKKIDPVASQEWLHFFHFDGLMTG